MRKPKALLLYGSGINCNKETAEAFQRAGAEPREALIKSVMENEVKLKDYDILAFPGGFLHGNAISAGRIMATALKSRMKDDLQEFREYGRPIIGICNGFQMLVKLGLLPGLDGDYETQKVTLYRNDSGRFEDRWVYLRVPESKCVWTKGINELYLPVRHGEGKFIPMDDGILEKIYDEDLVALQYTKEDGSPKPAEYPWNPNGSVDDIAGICDPTGTIFGLMPHPEAYIDGTQHPRWTREGLKEEGAGLQVFRNGVSYAGQI